MAIAEYCYVWKYRNMDNSVKTTFNLRLSLDFASSDSKHLLLKVKMRFHSPLFFSVDPRIERWELAFCLLNEWKVRIIRQSSEREFLLPYESIIRHIHSKDLYPQALLVDAPGILVLKSPTGSENGKSMATSNWEKRRYHPGITSANRSAPPVWIC